MGVEKEDLEQKWGQIKYDVPQIPYLKSHTLMFNSWWDTGFNYVVAKTSGHLENSKEPWFHMWYLNGYTDVLSLTCLQKSNSTTYNGYCKLMYIT